MIKKVKTLKSLENRLCPLSLFASSNSHFSKVNVNIFLGCFTLHFPPVLGSFSSSFTKKVLNQK